MMEHILRTEEDVSWIRSILLVVDDEKEIADLVEIYLVSDGYKVFKANNALDGLEILEKEEIHLVLLDIMMPGMDGLEMCRKIRETNNIPIIMLSAKSTDLDKILGLGTGADDYVVKPFNPLELTARVKSQLRRYTQLNPNRNTGAGCQQRDHHQGSRPSTRTTTRWSYTERRSS